MHVLESMVSSYIMQSGPVFTQFSSNVKSKHEL